MDKKSAKRTALVKLLETLWDYAERGPHVGGAKEGFIDIWVKDFEERFNLKFEGENEGH